MSHPFRCALDSAGMKIECRAHAEHDGMDAGHGPRVAFEIDRGTGTAVAPLSGHQFPIPDLYGVARTEVDILAKG